MMVRSLFNAGNDVVILDATNMTRWQRDQWQSVEWDTVFHFIDTEVVECQRRATSSGQDDVVSVIEEFAAKFEPLEKDERRFDKRSDEELSGCAKGWW